MPDYQHKTCVVTGGANGIGRCIVESLTAAGADVAFIDLDEAAGRQLERRMGERAWFAAGDISREATLTHFADQVIARHGRVDCLVNNACVSRKGLLSGCSHADFSQVLALGVTAPYLLAKLFMNVFAKGASIVNIASSRAFMSQADTESYTAAKGGISALTHALSASLAGRVRVNAVSPGWIDTRAWRGETEPGNKTGAEFSPADRLQHPVGRVGRPEDIAAMVLFLGSDEAGFVTGQNFVVDGGMTRRMIYNGDEGWSFTP